MKRIFVINGLPQSGKDTFVNFVSEFANVTNISSVDFVKEVAKFAGWDEKKDNKGRILLSTLKAILTVYNDIPYKKVSESIKAFQSVSDMDIMFIHIREPEEIERVVKEFNAESILVRRKSNNQFISNDSDRYVENYTNYTFVLNNDSDLEELRNKAKSFVEYLKGDDNND